MNIKNIQMFALANCLLCSCAQVDIADPRTSSHTWAGSTQIQYSYEVYTSSSSVANSSESPSSLVSSSSVVVSSASRFSTYLDVRNQPAKTYGTVLIGKQIWMTENLDYATPVGIGTASCYNDSVVCDTNYGHLYDWTAASYACPANWHLPTGAEWNILALHAGGASAGFVLKASNELWTPNSGIDSVGFAAMPGGVWASGYMMQGAYGYWWTADSSGGSAAYRKIDANAADLISATGLKSMRMSVRCIHN